MSTYRKLIFRLGPRSQRQPRGALAGLLAPAKPQRPQLGPAEDRDCDPDGPVGHPSLDRSRNQGWYFLALGVAELVALVALLAGVGAQRRPPGRLEGADVVLVALCG